ncbi:cell wall hydrolase SleB [Thermoanaerobacterium xylanolyticum LX-11]|uniref:Cell wall hydrolase SleB n=1 Tax=Thermoanaerobacterium xylanolyticum (strain ATCC 49914 / DSM 7097 / LX-11) TaxID=858215 RepID=F6BKL8_THEXL|nr:LysM peptidoglycan-binding domain-containing protein [Thermoanaerobacterium xylanolyticum]AEF17150.1 cell wall hydrolase SleB [Thermoanaerobacterium xylanolyticum LX-11]
MLKKCIKVKPLIASLAAALLFSQTAFAATYTVKPGDSLYKIGLNYGTTYNQIMKLNNISNTVIYPGQVLVVPGSDNTYTVQKGDSLYLIAMKYGTTVDALKNVNGLTGDMIYPGQVFVIPTSTSGTPSTSSSIRSDVTTNRGSVQRGVISYTNADLDLLSRLINAEAGGESYQAKVAVGAVIVNRVKSGIFPNSIKGVIYQVDSNGYYQFTPVENGWINLPATPDSISAARDALNGVDPTNGALYYFDDSNTNQWLWSLPVALRVGNMVFSYAR